MEFLGIDFGGTKVAFLLAGPHGFRHEETLRWPDGNDPPAGLAAISRVLRHLFAGRSRAIAVGIAIPALLDQSGRVVNWPTRPGWRGVDLRGYFGRELPGAVVRFADDGDLAAVSEARQAAGRDLLYVGVGTGVGGGLVLGGRLLRGHNGAVAEIGHAIVNAGGPTCQCGRDGCLQAIASGPATLRRAAAGSAAFRDASSLGDALAEGEPGPAWAVHETAQALASVIVTVDELVHPELVRLGGGFANALPELCDEVGSEVRALERPGHPGPEIELAAYGADSSLEGALLLAREPWRLGGPWRGTT